MKRTSLWVVVLVSALAVAFIASGCAKKQVVKEESGAKSAASAQMAPRPAPAAPAPPAPRAEAPKPAPAPRAEAPAPAPKAEPARPAPAPRPETVDLASLRILFAFDDANLSEQAKSNLQRVANWMSKNPGAKVQIEGNTCDIGTAEYNLALGERRATSAKKYLEGLGVAASRIATISYGEERPAVPNSNENSRMQNRRDEFVKK